MINGGLSFLTYYFISHVVVNLKSSYGNSDILQSRRHLFAAPNLFVNLPTVESEAALSLACRNKTISHKYQGVGVASSLSYPQVLVIESDEYKQLALLD